MNDVWLQRLMVVGQVVVVAVLGALVALGRDSAITDALLAVSGSLIGTSVLGKLPSITRK